MDDIIAAGAAARPKAEAFRCNGVGLTYDDMAARMDALAAALGARGVKHGDRVGVFLAKSLDSAVAVYGVMHAGAAYVPLDPGAPPQRLAAIAEDCGIGVIVSHRPLARAFDELAANAPNLHAIVDIDGADLLELGRAAPAPATPPARDDRSVDDLAYIIFTSGSTGVPKGIMHTHASGMAYARMSRDIYDLQPSDRMSNHSPLHFDMSTFDVFSGPLAGACTVIIPEMHTKLPASLSQLIQDEQISVWYSVPFALIQLVENGVLDKRDISCMRWVVFGGEPMSPKHLAAFQAHAPNARFSNSYGPAEVNQCTYHHLAPEEIDGESAVSIGDACPHTKLLILDGEAPAAEGELLAATSAMMRGYWRRSDLDAASILYRQDEDGVERRYYRTGDIVRRTATGRLDYLGRKDRQIKVRGYRVELDEVELALSRCPSISEAGAVLTPDGLTIAAFVTAAPGAVVNLDAVRADIGAALPSYAMPDALYAVESFARTTSGKIDRKALRQLSGEMNA